MSKSRENGAACSPRSQERTKQVYVSPTVVPLGSLGQLIRGATGDYPDLGAESGCGTFNDPNCSVTTN